MCDQDKAAGSILNPHTLLETLNYLNPEPLGPKPYTILHPKPEAVGHDYGTARASALMHLQGRPWPSSRSPGTDGGRPRVDLLRAIARARAGRPGS